MGIVILSLASFLVDNQSREPFLCPLIESDLIQDIAVH